ncbi:trimethylamine-corrinoid protein Co-methyltransferase [Acididesulfobacillus acetoxydans]|uniref:Methyltransferase n=1 Tax=Acididesulfobacillus acetoxydans TaxID=1561005 RepID=A0A8S0Y2N6_9FIRM|nr:trimethylamine methyltransferase family protein [Acididesulfobacillus acetoxydans]CAA7601025.1 trimethylamine-corrinoid protein Co-methyltransferase [Acididesulfobacillus acetoxydans]CEJ06899.1 Trimethylamine methyltransferase MttB [Acididesulfobacillus acetoxydans]
MFMGGNEGGSYRPLTQQEIEMLHKASMLVFEEVGMEVHSRRALEIFAAAGAEVDFPNRRVRADESWVMNLVKKAPSQVKLCGREEKHDLALGGKKVYLGTGGTALNVLDLESGRRRASTLADVRRTARLVDALENIHFFVLPVYPSDLAKENVDVNRFFAGMSHTGKHVMGGVYTQEGVRKVIRMAEAIAGGKEALRRRPFISMITNIMSPLKMDGTYTDLMLTVMEEGIPLATPPAPIAGATSPVTLAGTMVQLNVEALSGLLLAQLVNPGMPVLYSAVPTTADMRTMGFLFGAVENGIMNAAAAQLAQYYHLPLYATAGVTEAKIPDVQSGYEKMSTSLLVALAGGNYIHDAAGLLESGLTVAYEQYVLDDEINGMVVRAVRGMEVDKETLSLDVIKRVGPGGNYIVDDQTYQYMRTEFFLPNVADRSPRALWESNGGLDGREKARRIARKLLAEHEVSPIDQAVVTALQTEMPELIVD